MTPDLDRSTDVLDLRHVSKTFAHKGQPLAAVRDVSLTVGPRECVALVGESGSGKTTLANLIVGLLPPTAGTIHVAGGLDVVTLAKRRTGRRELAAQVQMVFQDPYGSLDPSKTIGSIVAEPLLLSGLTRQEIRDRVDEVWTLVGMDVALRRRRPRELSGGQRQRVGVARALAPRPSLLVLDEPVSALDVSVQGQVLSVLADVREQTGVAVLVIAHDLGVVRAVSDRTAVMYRGKVVEVGPTPEVLTRPVHPYAQSLLWSASAAGRAAMSDEARAALANEPSTMSADAGCVFRTRCWRAVDDCVTGVTRHNLSEAHWADCNVPLGLSVDAAVGGEASVRTPRSR